MWWLTKIRDPVDNLGGLQGDHQTQGKRKQQAAAKLHIIK